MPLWHLTVTEGAKPLPHFSCASSPERDFRRRQTRQKGLMTMSPCRDRKSAPRGKAVFAAICFRARERADVDEAYDFLVKIGAHIVHAPREDNFAPGYYSVLFEDPDG